MQVGPSAWDQPMGAWSFQASSAGPSLWSQSGPSSSKGANESMPAGTNTCTQNPCSSLKGADKAKPQESGSPEKKHRHGWFCSKTESVLAMFKPNNKKRGSISSSTSAFVNSVTEKPPFPKRSASERRAKSNPSSEVTSPVNSVTEKTSFFKRFASERRTKSNPPSEVTSPVHPPSNPELPLQGTVGKLNVPGDRSSKNSIGTTDSGLGDSLKRNQAPSLIEKFSDSSQQNLLIGDKLGNMLSKLSSSIQNLFTNPASPTHKGVPGGLNQHQKEELYKVLSPKMKEKLDPCSLPLGYEKLLYLLYVDKGELRLLLSDPKAKEQVCSVLPLPPEKMGQVQSDSTEEILCLLHKLFSNQEISDGFLISSKIDSPKSEQLFGICSAEWQVR